MNLLLVEDTRQLAASLSRGMREEGFGVALAATGADALAAIAAQPPDLIVLDLGLPDVDGMTVLSRARDDGYLGPILILTAREAVTSRVEALDRGADDYLVKPFAFEELCARVRALARRSVAPRWAPLSCGNVTVGADGTEAIVDQRTVPLSPRERQLLELFLRRQGEALHRRDILAEVFGYDFDPGTNVVDVHVGHLRRKLAAAGADVRIATIRGVGYRMEAPSGKHDG